jgi:hypothetical protein
MENSDGSWDVDLVRKYLFQTSSPGVKTGEWFKYMDPKGTLDNRKYVYEMLVGKTPESDTNPPDQEALRKSMIPWNQQHDGMIKAFGNNKACGSVVKLTFQKYMGWPAGTNNPRTRSIPYGSWNPVLWTVKSIRSGQPVRASLRSMHHYIGIVGFQGISVKPGAPKTDENTIFKFLCIEPWAGGARTGKVTINYAKPTAFLGIAHQVGTKIVYDGAHITEVAGYFPF